MKNIQKLSRAKFKISTLDVPNSELELDFNPIIAQLSDREKQQKYQLLHWQGRPKGDREWGIYDPKTDTYRCGVYLNHVTAYGGIKLFMLDDKTAITLPSAVVYFVGSLPIL